VRGCTAPRKGISIVCFTFRKAVYHNIVISQTVKQSWMLLQGPNHKIGCFGIGRMTFHPNAGKNLRASRVTYMKWIIIAILLHQSKYYTQTQTSYYSLSIRAQASLIFRCVPNSSSFVPQDSLCLIFHLLLQRRGILWGVEEG
jgi:hypothetical protein